MRLVLAYLVFAFICGGVLFGLPELRKTLRIESRRKLALILVVPLLFLSIIYYLEELA